MGVHVKLMKGSQRIQCTQCVRIEYSIGEIIDYWLRWLSIIDNDYWLLRTSYWMPSYTGLALCRSHCTHWPTLIDVLNWTVFPLHKNISEASFWLLLPPRIPQSQRSIGNVSLLDKKRHQLSIFQSAKHCIHAFSDTCPDMCIHVIHDLTYLNMWSIIDLPVRNWKDKITSTFQPLLASKSAVVKPAGPEPTITAVFPSHLPFVLSPTSGVMALSSGFLPLVCGVPISVAIFKWVIFRPCSEFYYFRARQWGMRN